MNADEPGKKGNESDSGLFYSFIRVDPSQSVARVLSLIPHSAVAGG
jgi:hypothetical protein